MEQRPHQISIALATYNGANHIAEQLESLARQTLRPLELVVTDDGSTDETLNIVKEFALGASFPVRIFQNEKRLGFANNFLKAASLCKGALIGFCDQDDLWDENKLDVCSSAFDDPDVMLSVHSAEIWDGTIISGKLFPEFRETRVYDPASLEPFMLVPGFVMVFRVHLLNVGDNSLRLRHLLDLGPGSCPMAHDAWIWLLATSMGRVATITQSLALYRQHSSNTIGAPANESREALLLPFSDNDYLTLANFEAECAATLQDLSIRLESKPKLNVEKTAKNFRHRSEWHRKRSIIYDGQSSLHRRLQCFISILLSGGYGSDQSKTRLGYRAAIKDLLFGIPKAYRLASVLHRLK